MARSSRFYSWPLLIHLFIFIALPHFGRWQDRASPIFDLGFVLFYFFFVFCFFYIKYLGYVLLSAYLCRSSLMHCRSFGVMWVFWCPLGLLMPCGLFGARRSFDAHWFFWCPVGLFSALVPIGSFDTTWVFWCPIGRLMPIGCFDALWVLLAPIGSFDALWVFLVPIGSFYALSVFWCPLGLFDAQWVFSYPVGFWRLVCVATFTGVRWGLPLACWDCYLLVFTLGGKPPMASMELPNLAASSANWRGLMDFTIKAMHYWLMSRSLQYFKIIFRARHFLLGVAGSRRPYP